MNYLRLLYKYLRRILEVDDVMSWYDGNKRKVRHIRTFGTEQTYDLVTTIEAKMKSGLHTHDEMISLAHDIKVIWEEYN